MSTNKLFVFLFLAASLLIRGFSIKSSYFEVMPVTFQPNEADPKISVHIEGKTYQLTVDTGSKPLSMHPKVLESIKKHSLGVSRRLDIKGNKYETLSYIIPKVQIGNFSIFNIKTREEVFDFLAQGSVLCSRPDEHQEQIIYRNAGRIGLNGFCGRNILLDFQNDRILMCSHINRLEKEGFDLKDFTESSFEVIPAGILLTFETDVGLKHFLLDTGASHTVLRDFEEKEGLDLGDHRGIQFFISSKFVMNGRNFGPHKILLFRISPLLESLDGVLGMDFLRMHSIFLDFQSRKALVKF